jgi:hypothetical protein
MLPAIEFVPMQNHQQRSGSSLALRLVAHYRRIAACALCSSSLRDVLVTCRFSSSTMTLGVTFGELHSMRTWVHRLR